MSNLKLSGERHRVWEEIGGPAVLLVCNVVLDRCVMIVVNLDLN